MGRFEKLEIFLKEKRKTKEIKKDFDEVYYSNIAKKAYFNGEFESALRYYSRALSYNLNFPEAWIGQVFCLIDLNELKEAILWADKGNEILNTQAELIALKGVAYARGGDFSKGIAYSDQSIKKGKNNPILWYCRGDILISTNPNSAEFCFKKAIEITNSDPFIFLRIGMSYISVGEEQKALSFLKEALKLNSSSALINFLMGISYENLNLREEALNFYSYALKIKPNYKECKIAYENLKMEGKIKKIIRKIKSIFYWREK